MSEAKMKKRIQELETALQDIIRERGDVQCLWKAIEDAKVLFNHIGSYGRMVDDGYSTPSHYAGPGIGTSVKVISENAGRYKVEWFVNANEPLYSTVPKAWVEF
jgi:hypothetical protein